MQMHDMHRNMQQNQLGYNQSIKVGFSMPPALLAELSSFNYWSPLISHALAVHRFASCEELKDWLEELFFSHGLHILPER